MGASIKMGGGGRRRRGGKKHAPMAEINVTPMVDVMLVLLIIFMVAAPLLTTGVPIDLPQAKGKQLEAKHQPLIINVKPDGKVFIQDAKEETPLEELAPKLKAIAGNAKGDDEPIFVRGDKGATYGAVVRVMGRINAAGFHKVSLVTEVEGG
jgi:biopolymer transport protein TolR